MKEPVNSKKVHAEMQRLLDELLDEMSSQGVKKFEAAEMSGFSVNTIYRWNSLYEEKKMGPCMHHIIALAMALGLELKLVRSEV